MSLAVLAAQPLGPLLTQYAFVAEFIHSLGVAIEADTQQSLGQWLDELPDESLFDAGMQREQMLEHLQRLIEEMAVLSASADEPVRSITLIGGRDKTGRAENLELTFSAGDIVCIVGPTGSGKSRLLADIECLAHPPGVGC